MRSHHLCKCNAMHSSIEKSNILHHQFVRSIEWIPSSNWMDRSNIAILNSTRSISEQHHQFHRSIKNIYSNFVTVERERFLNSNSKKIQSGIHHF